MGMELIRSIESKEARRCLVEQKSLHFMQVEAFMLGAQQIVPALPRIPSPTVRELRAKLLYEETMETIAALGVEIVYDPAEMEGGIGLAGRFVATEPYPRPGIAVEEEDYSFLAQIADGCCDVAVVSTGCLIACGLPDVVLQNEVNNNNLLKLVPGHRIRDDGKLIKPPNHPTPRLMELIRYQSQDIED